MILLYRVISRDVVRASKMVLKGYFQGCSQGFEDGSKGLYPGM
jgi:hypothetical protein